MCELCFVNSVQGKVSLLEVWKMRACKCICWVVVGLMMVCGATAASAQDEVYIKLTPLQSTIGGINPGDPQEVLLPAGGASVEAEVWASNWGWYDTALAYQAFLDCDTYQFYSNAVATGVCVQALGPNFQTTYVPYQMGIDTTRGDWIFTGYAALGAVNDTYDCVPDACGVTIAGRFVVSAAIYMGSLASDPGGWVYLGTFSFDVPLTARGTAEVGLNELPDRTMIKDSAGQAILPTVFSKMKITVETGMCCNGNGTEGTLWCIDGVIKGECDAILGVWVNGAECSEEDLNGDGVDDNCGCGSHADCADGDACTTNECVFENPGDLLGECLNANVSIDADECCDPTCVVGSLADLNGSGTVASNYDGNDCTYDLCDAAGSCALGDQCGVPTNPNSDAGDSCDDLNGCTTADICDGAGVCFGTDINTIPCPGGDVDCVFPETPVGFCEEGYCVCNLNTAMTLDVLDDDCCFEEGDLFDLEVNMGGGSEKVVGAQFMVTWDTTCIEYQGYALGTTFPLELYNELGEDYLFLAIGISPFSTVGSQGPDLLATLEFKKLGGCTECEVCFTSVNPMNTLLSNEDGEAVGIEYPIVEGGIHEGCSCWIIQAGEGVLDIPDSVYINSDCMLPTAIHTWDAPTASDECDGEIDMEGLCWAVGHEPYWKCSVTHRPCTPEFTCDGTAEGVHCDPDDPDSCVPYGGTCTQVQPDECVGTGEGYCMEEMAMPTEDLAALVLGGGEFAQGVTTFCCTVDHSCEQQMHDCWTVEVSDKNAMDVIVELSPLMWPGQITRCIEFAFYWNCVVDPTMWQENLVFGPPYDFAGKATPVILVQKGQYMCITAEDPLHTLRSVSEIVCDDDGMLKAAFHFDPFMGGNWLVNGNLDGDHNIDILDFGVFVSQFMDSFADGNTVCGYTGPHADIDGDGTVDGSDFAHISMNFLMASKDSCCPDSAANGVMTQPITEISVKELREQGLGHLVVADLNGDGVLNLDDMASFLGGQATPDRVKRGGRTLR